jgi:hypothetical protein
MTLLEAKELLKVMESTNQYNSSSSHFGKWTGDLFTASYFEPFRIFCTSLTGGGMNHQMADTAVYHLRCFFGFEAKFTSEPSESDIIQVFDSERMARFSAFLQQCNYRFSSIANILQSVRLWINMTKVKGACAPVLEAINRADVVIQSQKQTVSRKRKQQESHMTVDDLERKNEWTTFETLDGLLRPLLVVFEDVVEQSKSGVDLSSEDTQLCTRILALALVLLVKACRPETWEKMSVSMVRKAAENDGKLGSQHFKTHSKYGTNGIYFTPQVLSLLTKYIDFIRPHRGAPQGDMLLVNCSGKSPFGHFSAAVTWLTKKYIGTLPFLSVSCCFCCRKKHNRHQDSANDRDEELQRSVSCGPRHYRQRFEPQQQNSGSKLCQVL